MRKTRLVILPTKCLHQMGFLLLFLSCPVIGDWGRIRPETEDSHNAIQIDREGTCGLERDPPGGLQKFFDEDGSKQCRLSEDYDMSTPITRSGERRVDVRRIDQRRTAERRIVANRRDVRNDVRSRSVESRRTLNRNDARTRSRSLVRMESERTQRSASRNLRINWRRETERINQIGRAGERQSERREQRRSLSMERRESERAIRTASERRENERTSRNAAERRERDITRLARSQERERRESNRRSIQEQSRRQERREGTERRLSPQRREVTYARRIERTETRGSSDRVNLDRRMPEIRRTRSFESLARKSEERENLIRVTRNDNRRETEIRRLVTVTSKPEWNVRERRVVFPERFIKARRDVRFVPKVEPEYKKAEDEGLFGGVTKWMDLKSYDGFNTGDWTTNCVIGAVVYFFTTRQVKAV